MSYSGFPGGSAEKDLPVNVEDTCLIPGLGRLPVGGNSNPLQYCCLETPQTKESDGLRSMGVSNVLDMT